LSTFDPFTAPGEDAIDGIKVDQAVGPFGSGEPLGTLRGPEHPHNMAWGDNDGRTLYLAAQTGLYRIRLSIPGVRP